MTKERMRIEVAKILGAKWYATKGSDLWLSFKDLALKHSSWASLWEGGVYDHDSIVICEDVPNYPECLNACREMRTSITDKVAQSLYGNLVVKILNAKHHGEHRFIGASDFDRIDAGPVIHCEAFLKLHKAWEEDEESPSQ